VVEPQQPGAQEPFTSLLESNQTATPLSLLNDVGHVFNVPEFIVFRAQKIVLHAFSTSC
jgi:hypothetical protein